MSNPTISTITAGSATYDIADASVRATLATADSASSNNRGFCKLPDGTLICWNYASMESPCNTAWGSVYYTTNQLSFGNWREAFIAKPYVIAHLQRSSPQTQSGDGWVGIVNGADETSAGSAYIYCPNSYDNRFFQATILGIGRWKA